MIKVNKLEKKNHIKNQPLMKTKVCINVLSGWNVVRSVVIWMLCNTAVILIIKKCMLQLCRFLS